MKLWCNIHRRWYWKCICGSYGGILLPCEPIDLDEIGLEVIEDDEEFEENNG